MLDTNNWIGIFVPDTVKKDTLAELSQALPFG